MDIKKEDIRVLLVDGSSIFREALSPNLGLLGYSQIREAVDGPQALELAKDYQPHLVLMGTQMPNSYGYEVCRQMRQEDYGKMAAILGMSVNDNLALKEQWREAGADGFFVKDIPLNYLDRIIQEALARHQQG